MAQNANPAIVENVPPVLRVSSGVQTAVAVADIVIGVATMAIGADIGAKGSPVAGGSLILLGAAEAGVGVYILLH